MKIYFAIGHPGSGKTTILNKLEQQSNLRIFHADNYINWEKVIEEVDLKELGPEEYLPHANKGALKIMLSMFPRSGTYIYDGNGLATDLLEMCSAHRDIRCDFIFFDASAETLKARLKLRGDNFEITNKERLERKVNFEYCKANNVLMLNTDNTNKENPSKEISAILSYL